MFVNNMKYLTPGVHGVFGILEMFWHALTFMNILMAQVKLHYI